MCFVKASLGVTGAETFPTGKRCTLTFATGATHLTVDTFGLVLRVLVTAANLPEPEAGKLVLANVKQIKEAVSRLQTLWVDGGYKGQPLLALADGCLPLACPGCLATAPA